MSSQLPLRIGFAQQASLSNFITGGNGDLIGMLELWLKQPRGELFYLWGSGGSGRTHLLCGICGLAEARDMSWSYLPLGDQASLSPEVLNGLEQRDLICLDDLDAVAGMAPWEQALFGLYNRVRDAGHRLAVSAGSSPAEIPFALQDLRSRLGWGISYRVQPLDDEGKSALLRQQAGERGLELTREAAAYLLSRCPRDTGALISLIDRLDTASLAAQRRLTIPFLRSLLDTDIHLNRTDTGT